MFQRLFVILLLTVFTSACAQHSVFVSTPPGAQVFIDGQAIGETPCAYEYKLGNNTRHDVTIAKDGYEPVDFIVVTDEVDTDARNRWLAAGAVWSPLWIGTLFTKKLKDIYDFALRAEPSQLTAAADRLPTDKEL